MQGQIVRGVVRASIGLLLGAVPGALYAALVGVVHLGVSSRWDRAPAFAVGCTLAGALFGLLGGALWDLSGEPAPGRSPPPTGHPRARRPVGRRPRRPGLRPCGRPQGRAPVRLRRLAIGRSLRGRNCLPIRG
jgi:hypothetical protein